MTPQEETLILEARDILGRYLSQNPVIGSWQALMDYCAFSVRGPVERFRALRPDTRAVRGFQTARKRFYRQMLCAHAARQTAGYDPAS